jgi:hypothetical protein
MFLHNFCKNLHNSHIFKDFACQQFNPGISNLPELDSSRFPNFKIIETKIGCFKRVGFNDIVAAAGD